MTTQSLSTSAIDIIEPIHLAQGIIAFNTTRGVSVDDNPYSSFNICHYTADVDAHIRRCRDLLCRRLDISPDRLIIPRQTHSANIATITRLPIGSLNDIDALVTTIPDVVIGVNTADCVPILLADTQASVVAATHAGWKGAVKHIAAATVAAMEAVGAEPSRIVAAICPCICQDCFEVGDEVVEQFRQAGFDIDRHTYRHPGNGKAHIDLAALCRDDLTAVGVKAESIHTTGNCTRCNPRRYFSARRLGINSGRIFSGIALSTVKKL